MENTNVTNSAVLKLTMSVLYLAIVYCLAVCIAVSRLATAVIVVNAGELALRNFTVSVALK